MPDIPDISSMSPDRWLSKMQKVRSDLLEEFETIFAGADEPSRAAEAFRDLFHDYSVRSETGESEPLLGVESRDERLVFEHESGDETVELQPAGDGYWSEIGSDRDEAPEDVDAHHRELAVRALELIPWWTEGAFARSVGRPRDFVD